MPSTPPPLPDLRPGLTPWRASPQCRSGEPSRIHWPAILASASVSFALVADVFAWIVAHPHKAAPPHQVMNVAALDSPTVPPAPPARVFAATPVSHRVSPREAISSQIPLMETNSPLLPPPTSPPLKQHKGVDAEWTPPWQQPPPPKQPVGETYGTQVLFLNNREAAADMARREHKLLFVMHISGNFEDSCFT